MSQPLSEPLEMTLHFRIGKEAGYERGDKGLSFPLYASTTFKVKTLPEGEQFSRLIEHMKIRVAHASFVAPEFLTHITQEEFEQATQEDQ